MSLSQLIYVSTKNPLAPTEIFRIQDQAKRNNDRADVTGVLLFNREYFLQLLEGEREHVTHAFTVIAADDRHRHVTLLSVQDVEERAYPSWSMGLLDSESPKLRAVLAEALPDGVLTPATLTADSAQLIMRRTRTMHFTR